MDILTLPQKSVHMYKLLRCDAHYIIYFVNCNFYLYQIYYYLRKNGITITVAYGIMLFSVLQTVFELAMIKL